MKRKKTGEKGPIFEERELNVLGASRSLVSARGLKPECVRVLHEMSLVPVLIYGSETMIWKEEERSRIRVVQMDKITSLLGIRRMDGVPNARIRELSGMAKGVDERIEGGVLHWFSHEERMENNRIGKRLYVGEFTARQPRKEEVD